MLKFLIRKDVRKLLKRKDSDAGERGNCPFSCSCFILFYVFSSLISFLSLLLRRELLLFYFRYLAFPVTLNMSDSAFGFNRQYIFCFRGS